MKLWQILLVALLMWLGLFLVAREGVRAFVHVLAANGVKGLE
mgnify:CR=1 FL=1